MENHASSSLLATLRSRLSGQRVCLLAIGNPQRADDAAGPALLHRLVATRSPASLIDGGPTPEDYLGAIQAAAPELVLVLDAVDFQGQPGDVVLLEPSQIRRNFASTHHETLGALCTLMLSLPTVREVLVLGIQPAYLGRRRWISEPVELTLAVLLRLLEIVLPETRLKSSKPQPLPGGPVPGAKGTEAIRFPDSWMEPRYESVRPA